MKVKCTGYKQDHERYFTVGKFYEWNDGKMKCDNGFAYTTMVSGKNPDKWELSDWYTFEVVNEPKFKVGDIVKANEKSNENYCMTNKENGFIGKVVFVYDDNFISVEEIECKNGKGKGERWIYLIADCFDLVQVKQINITVDGAKTIAVLKSGGKVIKRAEAKCNPSDEFDFKTGAELAFKRLFEEEKKEEPKDTDFKVGDKVRYIAHDADGKYYPPYGTIGEIKLVNIYDIAVKWNTDKVKHSIPDWWWCNKTDAEKV